MRLDRWRYILPLRLRSLVRGADADRELDEELQDHVERQSEANIARGMTAAAARLAALRAVGGIEQRKEECRDERGISIIENLGRDVRLAVRQLRKQPAFTIAAVASLALGIGGNTAIFQLLNALSLRPLPVSAPSELVELRLSGPGRDGRHDGRNSQFSQPQFIALQRRQQAFSTMLGFADTRFNLAPSGEIRYVEGLWVSGSFFEMLGVRPAIGRVITPADDRPGCGFPGAVISDALWQREYGGRADILGQVIPYGSQRVPIIGVTPPAFFGVEVGRRFDIAMPICSAGFDRRDHWWLGIVGRLEPGWTRAQALAHLQGILPDVQRDTLPATYRADTTADYIAMRMVANDAKAGVSPLRQEYRQPLWILMAIAGLVLLIASVNLANLLLARASARQQEFSVRLAIGGSRVRVLQQVLTESALLAVIGSAAAAVVALVVSRSLLPLMSTAVDPVYLDLSIDWRFFGFMGLTTVATTLIFGLAPALRAARATVVRPGDRGATAPRAALAGRRALVSLQIAVTLVLLVGALLFVRSLQNITTQDMGMRPDGVIVASVFFPPSSFPEAKRALAYADLEDRLRAVPGVTRLAESYTTPMGGSFSDRDITFEDESRGNSNRNVISPDYFAVLDTPIVAGRDFDSRDTRGAPLVALVNEVFASQLMKGRALGHRFSVVNAAGVPDSVYEVIGIVKNQKYLDIRESFPPIFYVANTQEPLGLTRRYAIRSTEPAARAIAAVGAVLNQVDPAITVRYSRLTTQVSNALLQERLMARLAALFGVVALVLALVGLYGVVSYSVASRRAEIGLRVALGASRSRVLGLILGDVGRMLAIGLAAGVVIALVAARSIGSLLFGLEPGDPATLAMAAGLLAIAGVLSAAWPARHAAGIDPVQALRES